MPFLTDLLKTGIPLATPLLLAAQGELIVELAGVINVGIEGMVLAGALTGFAVSFCAQSAWAGAGAAAAAGMLLAGLFAWLSLVLRADQVVVGTALNILALGLTGVFYRGLFASAGTAAPVFAALPIPVLCRLPLIGPSLFAQNILGYAAWLTVPLCAFFLYRTRPGLRLRAVGEYPRAAEGAGVGIARMRVGAVLWGGGMAGLAGAFLSIGYTNGFVENMSAGRGFIALAVVILGRWRPVGVLFASLLFGMASALQFQFQASTLRLPYQLFLALPYLLALAALLLRARLKTAAPAALGEAYQRG